MSSTAAGQPGKWGPVLPVIYNNISMRSKFAPGIVGYGGRFYCFWVQEESNLLAYCVLSRQADDVWDVTSCFLTIQVNHNGIPVGQPEEASNSPSLVVFGGRIHLVFPNPKRQLIHMQLNPRTRLWESRNPVGSVSIAAATLAVFQEQIFCAYAIDDAGKIEVQRWDQVGWFNNFPAGGLQQSVSQLAMFELNGVLNLFLVPATDNRVILRYIYDSFALTAANLPNTTVNEKLMLGSGVTGGIVNNTGLLAYLTEGQTITNGSVQVTIKQLNPSPPNQQFLAKMTVLPPTAPKLGIVGNTLMAIWNNGAAISYTTRRVWQSVPPLSRWMRPLASDTPISQLTIPGTHDSAAVSFRPIVSTQYLDIGAQLKAGIRYIDLRAGFLSAINDKSFTGLPDDLIAYHGSFRLQNSLNPISPDYVTIKEIFDKCYNFLNHPNSNDEGILMQIKQEYPSDPNDAQIALFADSMMRLINKHEIDNPGRKIWRLDPTLPKLADIRGRIQLIRRFGGVVRTQGFTPGGLPTTPGINVSVGWPKNKSGEIIPPQNIFKEPDFRIILQDKWDWSYDFMARANKFNLVKEGLEAAKKEKDPKRWHINFASATAKYAFMDGRRIALGKEVQQAEDGGDPWPGQDYGVNKRLTDFFSQAKKGNYGTILMDYAEVPGDLILGIIRTNNFPE